MWSEYNEGEEALVCHTQESTCLSFTCCRSTAKRCSGSMTEGDMHSAPWVSNYHEEGGQEPDLLDRLDRRLCLDWPPAPSHLAIDFTSSALLHMRRGERE